MPIGTFRSPQLLHHEAPRQPREDGVAGVIELAQGYQNCIHDLEGFSHVWVLFWFHHARGWNDKVVPPRDTVKRGVLATRAPQRPNPIGLSVLRLVRIEGRRLVVGGHDLLDGTPVLDLKPYLPYCDSVPDASLGYVANLPAEAPDHRTWWEAKEAEPPRIYRDRSRGRGGPAGPTHSPSDQPRTNQP